MAKYWILVLGIAAAVGACVWSLRAAPPGPEGARIDNLLAVQAALQTARDHLQRGHYLAAVQTLEAKLEIIDAHRDSLRTLRDGYLGLIRELHQSGKTDEVETYVRRLKQLDPGAMLELPSRNAPAPLAPVAPAPVAPAPVAPAPVAVAPPPTPAAQAPSPFTRPPNTGTTPAALAQNSATSPAPTTTVRGVAGADPFAEDNSTHLQEARSFLARAEREFADRRYAEALALYDLANALAPKLLNDSRERWAYCKLHAVVQVLNQAGGNVPAQELDREVRFAVGMAPDKLQGFGQELLRKIHDRGAGAAPTVQGGGGGDASVEVRHGARQGQWALVETANFRLFHNLTPEAAERAIRQAEATRVTMTRKWFNENPAPWVPRCDVYLHATGQDYARATQQSPSVPGHSTIQNEGERILSRRIDLHVDDPNALIGVLPHETTHVVLAGRYGPKPLPRWADEGLAVLSEPTDRIQRHLNNLPQHYRDGLLFKLSHLMSMDNYPDQRSVGAFYAQGVSVCEFLVAKKGPLVFTAFLREGMRTGWEAAVQRHYGLRSVAELEQQWLAMATQAGGQIVRGE